MKILYILGAYKPRASANGICSDNVLQELVAQGNDVTVIANRLYDCPEFSEENGLKIHRIKPKFSYWLSDWAKVNNNALLMKAAAIINKLKLMAMSFSWPFVSPLYTCRFYKKAVRLYKKERFDKVIAVYTPVDSLLAGYKLKKKFPEVRFFPYFLDSLSGGYGPKFFSKEKIIKRGLKIEKKVFPLAEKIIVMKSSEGHQLNYNEEFREKLCFLDIPTLKKKPITRDKADRSDIKLLFVGTLLANVRNPDTLINAIEHIQNENIVYEFVGDVNCKEKFSGLINSLGNRLIFTDFVNYDKLEKKINEADILINIGNSVSTMVPSKIFEYMSYGKPIISTYDIEDEPSKQYLEKYPLALLLSGEASPEENAKKIESFINDNSGKTVDFEELTEMFYLNTPKAFVSEV